MSVDARNGSALTAIVFSNLSAEDVRGQNNQRKHCKARQRQKGIHLEHYRHDKEKRKEVAEDSNNSRSEHLIEHVHVAGDTRHQPADRIAIEELNLQLVQMLEHLHAHVIHRALADHLHVVSLAIVQYERSDQACEVEQSYCGEPRDTVNGEV